ncbi:MAG: DEAD/DEAH box helicase [Phycisphaerales bacterium]|nr:DEAD/DEAH box helicase [Phycisphaerales bacterium]
MTFADLRLIEPIVRAVAAEGYAAPTPIQSQAIPQVLAGRDVLGCARTGTGKTAAFALPILQRLAASAPSHGGGAQNRGRGSHGPRGQGPTRRPRCLILCPTRELASQIGESFAVYGRHLSLRHTVIFGGVGQHHQVRALRAGVDVLIATPGRLLDLMQQGFIDLGAIEILVLDEADRMLDMGFIHDIRRIIERVPAKRQSLLFSATMPGEIRRLADTMLSEPVFIEADPVASTAVTVSQSVYHVTRSNKPALLERLLQDGAMERTLVFTRTKHGADKVVRSLQRGGIHAVAIHGNKSQNARTHALNGFKSGRSSVLVATDIASRGIDVEEITHVVNFDIPNLPESYVHRIGRTARAGASGSAVSFCDSEEIGDLRAIERLIKQPLNVNEDHGDLTHTAPTPSSGQRQPRNGSSNGSSNGSGRRSPQSGGRGRPRGGRSTGSGAAGASRGSRRRRSSRAA